jgi:hypothetical protein
MNMLIKENPPKSDDEKTARRWRGPLFAELGNTHPDIDAPGSVTFPIAHFADTSFGNGRISRSRCPKMRSATSVFAKK